MLYERTALRYGVLQQRFDFLLILITGVFYRQTCFPSSVQPINMSSTAMLDELGRSVLNHLSLF